MRYLIDGHNLIGQIPGMSLEDEHDEAQLVERLKSYMGRKHQRCAVVFDSGLPGGISRDLSTHSVRVVFAHSGTNADRIILERIRNTRDPGKLIVVSADRDIVDEAARRRIRVMSPRAFAEDMIGPATIDKGSAADTHLTPNEVEKWLRLFGGEPDQE